jgi:branched-chain amino acid aminotransferase
MAIAELASVDGRVTPTQEATIALPDDGLYRGDGAFEVVRLYGGRPFALAEHLDRIERSAAAIELPVDRPAIERELAPLLERVSGSDGQLRIVLTRGGRRILLTEPLPAWDETLSLATVTYSPNVILDGVKSISYAANMQATRIAKHRGADEALLVRPDGVVLEAPTSTIFWVTAEGRYRTPALKVAVLESITRAKLVDELEVEEGEFDLEELLRADEAFLASTTREVHGVSAIDEHPFDAPGPRTGAAQDAFTRVVEAELTARTGAA